MSSEVAATAVLDDVAATHAFAARIAAAARPGDVVALVGELGAGKTELVRGLAEALGPEAGRSVCSPSYLLLNVYAAGRLPLAHFDAYFMHSSDDLERAGLSELRASGHLVAIEWADRVADVLPPDALWITLTREAGGPERRRARWHADAAHWGTLA